MKLSVARIGFWAGLFAVGATISYSVVQIMQLAGVLTYPTDEQLIYGTSLCIVIPFLIEILAFHYTTPGRHRFWSHTALTFATIYSVFVTANYVIQLVTVIPMTMKDRLDEVRVLQQTPHSLFWNFDALGYIFMGLATFAAIPLFEKKGSDKWVRVSFIAHAATTPLISIVYFYPTFSFDLLLLGFPWALNSTLLHADACVAVQETSCT